MDSSSLKKAYVEMSESLNNYKIDWDNVEAEFNDYISDYDLDMLGKFALDWYNKIDKDIQDTKTKANVLRQYLCVTRLSKKDRRKIQYEIDRLDPPLSEIMFRNFVHKLIDPVWPSLITENLVVVQPMSRLSNKDWLAYKNNKK